MPDPTVAFQILTTGEPIAPLLQLYSKFESSGVLCGLALGHRGYLAPDRSSGVLSWMKGCKEEFLIQCDEDVAPPVNILDLALHDKDFVIAPTLFCAGNLAKLNIHVPSNPDDDLSKTDESLWPGDGLVRIRWGGTGVICYKRSAMERVVAIYGSPFVYDVNPDGSRRTGVDTFFCKRVQDIGLEVWADRDMLCGHYRKMLVVPGKDGKVRFRRLLSFWHGDKVDDYTSNINEAFRKAGEKS